MDEPWLNCASRRATAATAISGPTRRRPCSAKGRADAAILFVGEQPGDQEDLQGRPFVGPAGQLFDRALAEAGIDREQVYVTNAVKHFKFELRGKRRIHQKPDYKEILACKPWLECELAALAAPGRGPGRHRRALAAGPPVTIGKERGRFQPYRPSATCSSPSTLVPAAAARRAGAGGGISPLRRGAAADRRRAAGNNDNSVAAGASPSLF